MSLVRDWDGKVPQGFLDEPGTALAPGRDWSDAVRYGERHPGQRSSDWVTALQSGGVMVGADGSQAAQWAGQIDDHVAGAGPHDAVPRCIVTVKDHWNLPVLAPGWGMLQVPLNVPDGARWVPVRFQVPAGDDDPGLSNAMWRPWSPSTRRIGFIAATDLGSTVCAMLGADRPVGAGRAVLRTTDEPGRLEREWRSLRIQEIGFTLRWAVPVLAGLLVLAVFSGVRAPLDRGVLVGVSALIWVPLGLAWLPADAVASIPFDEKFWALLPYACALILSGLAIVLRKKSDAWHRWGPDALHGMLMADALLGFPSQTTSPLGYGLAEAARFHGIGNETAGLWLGVVAWSARYGYMPAAVRALTAAVAIGAPGWGANAGCGLAALCAGSAFLIVSIPIQRRRIFSIATVAIVVLSVAGLAWRDSRRPVAQRSHMGNLVGRWAEGNSESVKEMVVRKVGMNLRLAGTSRWMVLLVPTTLWFAWLCRARQIPGVVAVGPGVALLANDSGVVAAAMSCAALVPMLAQAKNKTAPDKSPGRSNQHRELG